MSELTQGVHLIGEERYHADPCVEPSLSASIATTLLTHSPKHAWQAHPRLNPDWQPTHDQRFDIGSAAHALVLGDEAKFEIVDADDYRTKEAKAARDEAYEGGRIPLLIAQWERVKSMHAAAVTQLTLHDDKPFIQGKPEMALVWQEGSIWCRCLLDWLPHDPQEGQTFFDYKTTSASANPDVVDRRLFGTGADIQAAFYLRGIKAVFGIDATFAFVIQETEPPYALCVVDFDRETMDVAERKVERAIALWGECLATDRWPAYRGTVA